MEVREASAGYGGLTALPSDAASFGCRKAEAGIFPDDWTSRSINELAARHSNAIVGGPFGSDLVSKDYVPVGVPVIRGQNMSRHYVAGDFVFVSTAKARRLQANLARPDDIVFTQRGTLGQVALVPFGPFDEYVVSQSQMKLTLRSDAASAEYVYQYFTSEAGQKQILESAIQTGVPHTNLGILRCYQVPLPPTKAEQEAIAEALSDADALIESLEQLIAKKRQIKQGTMQALLTGQCRLPGFMGEWLTRKFGEVAAIRRDRVDPRKSLEPEFCIELEHIGSGTGSLLGSNDAGSQSSLKSVFHAGDVLFGKLRAYLRKYWFADRSGVCSTEIWCLTPKEMLRSKALLFYLVQMDGFIDAASLAYGTHMPRSDWNAVKEFVLRIPQDDEEQAAIATILSEMDTELAELETRLAKTRQLKQGMMQELLTGRIRLV